jgi:hypothetical protein
MEWDFCKPHASYCLVQDCTEYESISVCLSFQMRKSKWCCIAKDVVPSPPSVSVHGHTEGCFHRSLQCLLGTSWCYDMSQEHPGELPLKVSIHGKWNSQLTWSVLKLRSCAVCSPLLLVVKSTAYALGDFIQYKHYLDYFGYTSCSQYEIIALISEQWFLYSLNGWKI